MNRIRGKTNGEGRDFRPLKRLEFPYFCKDSILVMSSNPHATPLTDRDALELLMQRTEALLDQFKRLRAEHEVLVQRARSSAEHVVRLQGDVDALKAERNELKAALELPAQGTTERKADSQVTAGNGSHSPYSQPDPTSASLPKEVINEIVQEIDACIALLQR